MVCRPSIAALVTLLGVTIAVAATQDDNRNAAAWYARAFERLDRVPDDVKSRLLDYANDPRGAPSPELRAALDSVRPALVPFQRGARQQSGDFNLDYSQGFELMLPHLHQVRTLARFAKVDAITRLHDGDHRGAAAQLAELYRVGNHLRADRTLISSLVGRAVFNEIDGAVQIGLDRALFDPADAADLARGVGSYEATDPFGMSEAVVMEQEIAVAWLSQRYGTEEQRAAMPDDLSMPGLASIAGLSDEAFADAVAGYDKGMTEVVGAFLDPDRAVGKARLEAIERELLDGAFGPLAKSFSPALVKVFGFMVESEKAVAERAQVLAAIAAGAIEPVAQANAAVFYLEAAERLRAWPAEAIAQLRSALGPGSEIGDPLAAALAETGPIIDLVREGTTKARCDFDHARPPRGVHVAYAYQGAMRDLLVLLNVEATRGLGGADLDRASDRLALALRVEAHLGTDEPITSSMVAHDAYGHTLRLAERLLARPSHAPDQPAHESEDDPDGSSERSSHSTAQHEAMRTFVLRDPFGYVAAIDGMRSGLEETISRIVVQSNLDEAASLDLEPIGIGLREIDGTRLLGLVAVIERMATNAEDATEPLDPSPLDGVLDLEAYSRAGEFGPQAAPLLAAGDVEALGKLPLPTVADVDSRLRRARADLRAGLILFAAPVED